MWSRSIHRYGFWCPFIVSCSRVREAPFVMCRFLRSRPESSSKENLGPISQISNNFSNLGSLSTHWISSILSSKFPFPSTSLKQTSLSLSIYRTKQKTERRVNIRALYCKFCKPEDSSLYSEVSSKYPAMAFFGRGGNFRFAANNMPVNSRDG